MLLQFLVAVAASGLRGLVGGTARCLAARVRVIVRSAASASARGAGGSTEGERRGVVAEAPRRPGPCAPPRAAAIGNRPLHQRAAGALADAARQR
jgi:hypothetical protein